MNFKGLALPLAAGDVTIVAGWLQCEIAALRAVIAVEAAGKGFGPDGRPLILFEPHVFWREMPVQFRNAARQIGLAYPKLGAKPYPKTQAERYCQLEQARRIDQTAALKSCSWGLGQIMGFNHRIASFDTVQMMVSAMTISEGAQLLAMAKFIEGNKLSAALKAKNWAAFARGYNGKAYAKKQYDVKLAAAYAQRPKSERIVPPMPSQDDYGRLAGRVAEHALTKVPPLVLPVELPQVVKPVSKPVQTPATGPEVDLPLPTLPPPNEQAGYPKTAAGIIAAMFAVVGAGMLATACALPDWVINLLGFAARCMEK